MKTRIATTVSDIQYVVGLLTQESPELPRPEKPLESLDPGIISQLVRFVRL